MAEYDKVKAHRKTLTLIKRFEQAAVALSWKGSQPSQDWGDIEREYKDAVNKLREHTSSLAYREVEEEGDET